MSKRCAFFSAKLTLNLKCVKNFFKENLKIPDSVSVRYVSEHGIKCRLHIKHTFSTPTLKNIDILYFFLASVALVSFFALLFFGLFIYFLFDAIASYLCKYIYTILMCV